MISFPYSCNCGNILHSDNGPSVVPGRDGLWSFAWCDKKHGGCSYHGWHRVDEALAATPIKPTRRLRPSPLALRAG